MQVVTGAMGALIPKLFQLLNEEYKLQKGVRQDVEFLTKELPSMHEALRKVADVPRDKLDKQVKIWADEVRELSYVMEDVVDSFLASAEGSEPATNSHKLKELLNKMGNLLPKGKVRHKTAKKIQGIKILVKEVADRRDRYRVNDAVANLAATTRVDPRLLALFKEQKELVGIDVARDEIMKKLTDGDANEPKSQLKILSIFGFGGLGKTTLAKVMHDKLRENFVYGAFISVGQKPDLKKVLRDIIIELESEWYRKSNALVMDEKQLIQNLQELLENKRYFIIIDDIWDVEDWEIIRCAFKDSNCGSRIITTTHIFKVAEESDEVYQLKPLSHDNSEKLFYARLYGGKSESPFAIPTNTSERILQKCGGVPLAVLTIASLLEGKPREDWSKVYDSIGFGEGENHTVDNTRKILLFSYHDLPYYLRACLLHISIYQEDYIILKSSLIWKWVAEGFIKEEPGISQFEIGERYFSELVNRSMIQPIESKDLGLVVGCRVHDLVLDMICLLSKEQNFVTVVDTDDETASSQSTMARRLAVQKRVIEKGDSLDKVCKPQVRSFNATTCDIRVMPSMSSFGALRVLAMEDCTFIEDGNYHLNHLGSLIQLRYLGLRNMPIIELPEEIGNLKFLQTLDLGGTRINCFPQSIGLLRHLKCLNVDFSGRKEELHLLRNLTLLEELTLRYDRGSPEVVVELGKLTELRKLYMAICFMSDFDDDDCMVKALVKSLGKLQKIQVLHLRPELMDISCDEWHGYAPPRSLHELRLRTYSDMLPEWINPSLLPNLTQLSLMVEEVDAQDMEILGSFPELVTLTLESDSDMDSVPDVMGNGKLFPKLKYFSTPALRFLQGAMPSLECLVFDLEHPKLEVFEFGLVNLPSLQRVKCNGGTEEQRHALKVGIKAHPNCPTLEFEYYFKPRGWFYY